MTFSLASLSFWDLLLWCFVLIITLGASILLVLLVSLTISQNIIPPQMSRKGISYPPVGSPWKWWSYS
ncbi:hypothetical protein HAV15_007063 [Penicillium sp. str. |nr:hypothetical protein HAV15_007063 [Penicillium sp. str. \